MTESAAPDKSFAALGSLIRGHRARFAGSTVVRAVAAAVPALHPYFLAQLATSIDEPDRALRYLVLLFGSGLLHGALWSACDFFVSARINPLSYEFKRLAYDTVWSEDYQRFVDRPSGKVASYVNDLRQNVARLWDIAHFGFVPTAAGLPVYVFLLWRSAAGNAVSYAVFLVGAGILLTWMVKPVHSRQRRLTDRKSSNNGRVFDSYANFVNVFSFRSHRKEINRNDAQIDDLIEHEVSFSYALAGYWTVASLLVRAVLWGAIMAFSWWQFDRGHIDFVAMVVSITVLIDFTHQYWQIVHFTGEWIDASASYREAYNYLFPGRDVVAEHREATRPGRGATSDDDGAARTLDSVLEVRNLSFAYPDAPGQAVLHDVSFSLARGEKLGVVGRSGEGKSTLIKILLGFYAPTAGEIKVDGRTVGPAELSDLQSYVPQDTSLFQETIAYNIGYAVDDSVEHDAVVEAARRANVADFVDSLPAGYDTYVGERGVKLSLGQRQRIAIARAFLKDADLIVLDEATSALDSETEARIQTSLTELWQDKAAIVIAHRLATLNDVDRILVIDGGRVVEHGPKAELLARPGLFADLWGLQQSGLLEN